MPIVPVPRAVFEQVMDMLMNKGNFIPRLVKNEQRRVAEVSADQWGQAVLRDHDYKRGHGSFDASAVSGVGGDQFKKLGVGISGADFPKLQPLLALCVVGVAVAMIFWWVAFTASAATVQQNDKNKKRSFHLVGEG